MVIKTVIRTKTQNTFCAKRPNAQTPKRPTKEWGLRAFFLSNAQKHKVDKLLNAQSR
jgi:hypothetical protein